MKNGCKYQIKSVTFLMKQWEVFRYHNDGDYIKNDRRENKTLGPVSVVSPHTHLPLMLRCTAP